MAASREQRGQPHWLIPVILGAVLALVLTWFGVNDWRPLCNMGLGECPGKTTAAETPDTEPSKTPNATEYEQLSVTSLSGPQRKMLTTPPSDGDFNCLAKDSFLAPESNFVWIKDVEAHGDRPWHSDSIEVQDGHIYTLAIYPINCGLATDDPDDGILRESTLRIDVPRRADSTMRIGSILRSTYLDHPVWDGVRLTGAKPFRVTPVPGSVQYMTAHIAESDGKHLPDSVFGTAQQIGDLGQDGVLRACAKADDIKSADCHVLVYAQVQVDMI